MNFFLKRRDKQTDNAIALNLVNWLLDHHYEVIAPLLVEWKESFDD